MDLRGKYVLCLLFFGKIFKVSKLLVCWIFVALFYYFVCTSSSSQIKEWFYWSFHLMVFEFEFDLHRKFIDHYERCILVPYYHSCEVKFKSIQNIVFQKNSLNTFTHTFTHRFAKAKHLSIYLSFSWSFTDDVMLITLVWLIWRLRCHTHWLVCLAMEK